MADFTTIRLAVNTGTNAAAVWTAIGAAATEIRWSDVATATNVASASWPAMIRPAATANVAYLYAYTADATNLGFLGTSTATPVAYSNTAQFLSQRWDWDATGTFASAPVFTAYGTTAHTTPAARGGTTDNILSGNATDTGATARSYLKGNLYGQVTSTAAPIAAPAAAAVVTDGTTGSVSPTAGANWLATFQGLMADLDYITFAATPAATVANTLNCILALFTGPNMGPATYVPVITLKYTWT